MKLWVDDMRQPPNEDWRWVTTSDDAINALKDNCCSAISLDHDLGGPDTTRAVVTWIVTEGHWPKDIYVHTANPVGAEWLMGTCTRYCPPTTHVERRFTW